MDITRIGMKCLLRVILLFAIVACFMLLLRHNLAVAASQDSDTPVHTPQPVAPVTDEYFGTKVVDPYCYMENLKDPEVMTWFKGQDEYTRSTWGRVPGRAALLARIKELDHPKSSRRARPRCGSWIHAKVC
jgi:hypothetical protein